MRKEKEEGGARSDAKKISTGSIKKEILHLLQAARQYYTACFCIALDLH
jgi:hypothetical protein